VLIAAVSRRAAAPARSGGAAPTIRSVASVTTGATAIDVMIHPATMTPSPETRRTWVISAKPSAPESMQIPISQPGGTRRTRTGASIEPTTNPPADDSVHSAASRGVCRVGLSEGTARKRTLRSIA
jgi:hypothetical protein